MTVKKRRLATWEWSCRCERCGRQWVALGDEQPQRCPSCKARGWAERPRPYIRKQKKQR